MKAIDLLQRVADDFGVQPDQVKRGQPTVARRLVMYLLWRKGITQRRIARWMKVHERTVLMGCGIVTWELRLRPQGPMAMAVSRLTTSTRKESS